MVRIDPGGGLVDWPPAAIAVIVGATAGRVGRLFERWGSILASAGRFAWVAAKPITKSVNVLRRAGLFAPGQATAAMVCGAMLLIGLLVLQKFGVPYGDEGDNIEACLPFTYVAIATVIAMTQKIGFDYIRLALYSIFAILAVSTNVFSGRAYSASSIEYALAIYFPFTFRYFVSIDTMKRLMRLYVNASLVIVAVVVLQHLMQLAASPNIWPDLDKTMPDDWLVKGYNYIQPIKYGMRLMKPNAVFMLEASFVSQYIALGLIVELIFFGRIIRMAILTAGLLLTFAGTGLLLVAACAPFLIFRMPRRVLIVALVVAGLTAFAAVELGWYSQVSHRLVEYQSTNSSAHERFVSPATAFFEFLQRPDSFYSGLGAGQIERSGGVLWWPVTKVTIEYGLLTTIVFAAFFIYSLFGDGGHLRLGFAMFVFYNFLSGSFAVPVNALTCVFFCTLFRVANPPPPPKRMRRVTTPGIQAAETTPEPEVSEPEPEDETPPPTDSGAWTPAWNRPRKK